MTSRLPKFVQKYGYPLGKKGIEELKSKISHKITLSRYKEYSQFNNLMYLFQWRLNDDITYLNKDQVWETFSEKLIGRHHYSRDLDNQNNTSINITPLKPCIYNNIMTEALVKQNSIDWLSRNNENNDIRCIFQEVNPQRINDLIEYLSKMSKNLKEEGQREGIYELYLSHLCIKISGPNQMDLGEPITDSITNEPLDYEGLLKLASKSKKDPPLKQLLQLLIKHYGLSKPAIADCDNDRWLVISN
ncbi:cytochrome b termination protein 1 [Monosporozyma unispora]|nr:hypothetical protein C6P44_001242 [Kazachstania unispora]